MHEREPPPPNRFWAAILIGENCVIFSWTLTLFNSANDCLPPAGFESVKLAWACNECFEMIPFEFRRAQNIYSSWIQSQPRFPFSPGLISRTQFQKHLSYFLIPSDNKKIYRCIHFSYLCAFMYILE